MGLGYNEPTDSGRLVVPLRHHRPFRPQSGGLVDANGYDGEHCYRCLCDGDYDEAAARMTAIPFRSWRSILLGDIPRSFDDGTSAVDKEHVAKGHLLGQRLC